MWQLSAHSHSLARLYRFRDPKMETAYHADINASCVYSTQLHYIGIGLIHVHGALIYFGARELETAFWIKFAIATICAFWCLNGFVNPVFKRHRVFFHFLFCVTLMGALVATCLYEPTGQTNFWYSQFIPDGQSLVLEGPIDGRSVQNDAFRALIAQILMAQMELSNIVTYTAVAQFQLSLNGLSRWTILGHGTIFSFCVMANSLLVTQSFISMIFGILHRLLNLVLFLILGLLTERIQRQRFLAQTLLERHMHSAMTADSILNHMLKNTLADAAAYIELFLAGSVPTAALQDSVLCLRRGMKACKQRQLYLKLVEGNYAPVQNVVSLREFGEQLVAGRSVRCEILDMTVYLDCALLSLILDNALSNAVKHGRPEDPDVAFVVHEVEDTTLTGGTRLEFLVTNAANPNRPQLTPAVVTRLIAGDPHPLGTRRRTLLSDGIGFAHSVMAADVGGFALALRQEGDRVVFSVVVDTQEATKTASISPAPEDSSCRSVDLEEGAEPSMSCPPRPIDLLPPQLRFFILDDSATSRTILGHQIRVQCPKARVTAFGAAEGDIDLFVAHAIDEADVVIVDQRLEYEVSYLGTSILRRLALLGFPGLMCIRSGDDSVEDRKFYQSCGAHCFLGKDCTKSAMMEQIAVAYFEYPFPTSAETLYVVPRNQEVTQSNSTTDPRDPF